MIQGKPLDTKTYLHRMIVAANQGTMTSSKANSIQRIHEGVKELSEANPVVEVEEKVTDKKKKGGAK